VFTETKKGKIKRKNYILQAWGKPFLVYAASRRSSN